MDEHKELKKKLAKRINPVIFLPHTECGMETINAIFNYIDREDYVVVKRSDYEEQDEPCPACERIDCICDLKEHGFVAEKEKKDEQLGED